MKITKNKLLSSFCICALLSLSTSPSLALLDSDIERATCSGYSDAMLNTYHTNHYKLMSFLYGTMFEQDGAKSDDPNALQAAYDAAFDKVDEKGRLAENLVQLCEDEYLHYMKEIKKEDLKKRGSQLTPE